MRGEVPAAQRESEGVPAPPPRASCCQPAAPSKRPPLPPLAESLTAAALTLLGMGALAGLQYSTALPRSGLGLAFASLAASAALLYAAPAAPLAQPRNVLGSHLVCAVIGVGVRELLAGSGLPGALPAAVALAVALSVGAMAALGVQHPAGGGTAFLAVASPEAAALGWLLVPSVVLGAGVLVGVALLGNLVGRPYPQWWW
jgi:CBS-domain-containing membrane protein